MLEQVAHLQVVDAVRVQVHIRHRPDDGEQPVAGIELFDLIGELEALEDGPRGGREAVDIGHQIGRDVLRIAQQLLEGKRTGVVERMGAFRVRGLAQQLLHGVFRHTLGGKFLVLFKHLVLGGLQYTIQTAQHHDGKHDEAILWGAVRAAQTVGDFPDVAFKLVVQLQIH